MKISLVWFGVCLVCVPCLGAGEFGVLVGDVWVYDDQAPFDNADGQGLYVGGLSTGVVLRSVAGFQLGSVSLEKIDLGDLTSGVLRFRVLVAPGSVSASLRVGLADGFGHVGFVESVANWWLVNSAFVPWAGPDPDGGPQVLDVCVGVDYIGFVVPAGTPVGAVIEVNVLPLLECWGASALRVGGRVDLVVLRRFFSGRYVAFSDSEAAGGIGPSLELGWADPLDPLPAGWLLDGLGAGVGVGLVAGAPVFLFLLAFSVREKGRLL